jgi:hypothetical protein
MALEQYIVRELKRDIKYLIQKVADLEQKLEEAHPSPKPYTESEKMQDDLEPIDEPDPSSPEGTFKRYEGYREWDKTHDNYKDLK